MRTGQTNVPELYNVGSLLTGWSFTFVSCTNRPSWQKMTRPSIDPDVGLETYDEDHFCADDTQSWFVDN